MTNNTLKDLIENNIIRDKLEIVAPVEDKTRKLV